jgi:hypothetical protein
MRGLGREPHIIYHLLCAYIISDSIAEFTRVVIYLPKLPETTRGTKGDDDRLARLVWLSSTLQLALGASHVIWPMDCKSTARDQGPLHRRASHVWACYGEREDDSIQPF